MAYDTHIPTRLGDTSRDYQEWRAKVLQIREMAEYRLRKLWRLNFSPEDIAADRHWEVYPQHQPRRRHERGMPIGLNRGRGVTERGRQKAYAQALLKAAQRMLRYNRLEPEMRAAIEADEKRFADLVKEFSGLGRKPNIARF